MPNLRTAPSIGVRSESDWPYGANIDIASRSKMVVWAESNGYRLSRTGHCLHWMRGRRCDGLCRHGGWMDHITCWTKDGKPAALVSQPYSLGATDLAELAELGSEFHVMLDGQGWYGHGTVMIVLERK